MKSIIYILILGCLFANTARVDVVHLKNGDVVKGVIIENAINDYIKLEMMNGAMIKVIKYDDILKFTVEQKQINSNNTNGINININNENKNTQSQTATNTYTQSNNSSMTIEKKYRKGFIIGIGYGGQSYSMDITSSSDGYYNYSDTYEYDETGAATDFKIGFAPSNKLSIYYSSKVAWGVFNEKSTATVAGFGFSIFMNSSPDEWNPSPFFSAGYGLATFVLDYSDEFYTENYYAGTGLSFGFGYEFAKGLTIEMNWVIGSTEYEEDLYGYGSTITNELDFSFVMLTANFLSF